MKFVISALLLSLFIGWAGVCVAEDAFPRVLRQQILTSGFVPAKSYCPMLWIRGHDQAASLG
jgi:hypothetical protein